MAEELALLGAAELLRRYRTKQLSPVEVTRAALARIDAHEKALNAFREVWSEEALGNARASEARWMRGEPLGALDGVPATIKDLMLTKGKPTLRGSRTVEANQSWDEDAPSVARMREAGAIFLGKTTTPEFGWKGVTDSGLTGITRNPWNPVKTPGGSSGGAAVAAAAGFGALHIGSDGGGSIRMPCGFTGTFGIKPTFGRVPHYPPSPMGTVSHVGPMTRTVADAALMLNVITLPDERDWYAVPHDGRDYRIGLDDGVAGLRIAYSRTLGYAKVDPEVTRIVDAAAQRYSDLGAVVTEVDPGFENPRTAFEVHWYWRANQIVERIPSARRELVDPGLLEIAAAGRKISPDQIFASELAREALGRHMSRFHARYDLLLTPQLPLTGFDAGIEFPPGRGFTRWIDWSPFTWPFNLTQQPAATVPCGIAADGLPVCCQIVGAKWTDALVLRAARALEATRAFPMPRLV
jgi:aspartyl-tRNA(Asn)/glutamyl-tRNA(Gln) amidotransferase subunit A